MNKICRSVWNDALGAWTAVQENGRAMGKLGRGSWCALMLPVIAAAGSMTSSLATAQTTVSGAANNGGSGKTATTDSTCNQNFVNRNNPGNPSSGGSTYMLQNGCSTAVGNNARATSSGTALGDRASAISGGVALGLGASSTQNSSVSIGAIALSSGNTSIAIGRQSAATADFSTAIGNVAYASGISGIAMGDAALASGYRSVAIGSADTNGAGNDGVSAGANYDSKTQTRASGARAVALGSGAVAAPDDSVALGSNSVGASNAQGPAVFSGDAIPAGGAVSVGKAGAERQIKNVAGGTAGTDAVNVNQLAAVSNSAVKYDTNPDGSINYNSVTLNPGGSPSTLGNVATGDVSASSTDAVNGSQLYETNQNVAKLGDTLNNIAGDTSQAYTDQNGTGIRYARTNEAGLARTDAFAQAPGSTAVGYNATASADNALALGREATASYAGSVALGANAVADGSTLGNAAYNPGSGTLAGTNPVGEVSVGSSGAERRLTNVAAGSGNTDAVNVSQLKSLGANVNALGGSMASAIGGGASYDPATGKVTNPTYNIGGQQQSNVSDAINALNQGWNVTTSGNASGTSVTGVKPGDTMTIDGGKNIALRQDGTRISIATSDAPSFTSVGIDNGGPTLSGSGLDMAGQKITNVAPGDVSAGSTDAVNGSQLNDTNQKIRQASDQSVKYDTNPDGSINYNSVTLNPGGSPSKLGNVATGDVSASSTDAVNGSQLYETNQNVTKLGDTLNNVAGDTSQAYTDQNGTGIRYARTNEAGLARTDAFAQAPGSTAVGYNATAKAENALALGRDAMASYLGSVALGANAVSDGSTLSLAAYNPGTFALAGLNPVGEVSVGRSGGERRLTNVAAGAADTDAVNVSQLKSVQQNVDQLDGRVTNIENGGGIKYFRANGGLAPDSQANGAGSVAAGPGAIANGVNSVAMGNGAIARQDGDVALGEGAVADRGSEDYTGKYSNAHNKTAGTVSVGAPGAERTVSNVADGREDTDAVNVRQLDGAVKAANDYTDQQVQKVAGDVVQVGDKLDKLDNRMTNVEGDVTNLKTGSGGMFQVSQDAGATAPQASGERSTAGGNGAIASGAGSTALGNGATASGKNAVSMGAGSVADRDNTVSVGAPGQERQLTNVAPGTAGTDAVNVNQLNAAVGQATNRLQQGINDTARKAYAGVAAATALTMIPDVDKDKTLSLGVGMGSYQGYQAIAIGGTARITENIKMRAGVSTNGTGSAFGVGASMQW
nr:YadA-like family protein [Burkholderia lata]